MREDEGFASEIPSFHPSGYIWSWILQAIALERGANIVRVHNVALIEQIIRVIEAIKNPS